MPHRRAEAEASIIDCSDAVLASCSVEAEQIASLYGADPDRIRIVPLGVDHAFFGPGHRPQARRALGLPLDGPAPPLRRAGSSRSSAPTAAVETLAELSEPQRGAVPPGGRRRAERPARREVACRAWSDVADARGVSDRVHFIDPQPHELLSSFYRAADVCIVPSRSESFGLVALEAAACGTPVVASAVGGLTTLVDDGRTGFLVEDPTPDAYADAVRRVFDEPLRAERLSTASVLRARRLHLARRRRSAARPARRAGDRAASSSAAERRASLACRSSICPQKTRWRPWSAHRRLGGREWPPAACWWAPSARTSRTAPRRIAGSCGSRATKRTSSRSG